MRLLTILIVLPALAHATVIQDVPFETYVRRAQVIVRGSVVAQQVVSDDSGGRISTLTEIHVRDVLKGQARTSVLVRQPGGILAEHEQRVSGAARFAEGEEVVLFLEPARDDAKVYLVLGMAAGKLRLEKARTGELRAVRDLQGLSAYENVGGARAPSLRVLTTDDQGEAAEVLARIRELVRRGARR